MAAATDREHPDLAFVGLGMSGEHALEMISEIVREASCPVIALLESDDPVWVNEAAKRRIFAYIVDGKPEEMQGAIEITIRRYAEYTNLEGAFRRRAVIERAKGIVMAQRDRRAGGVRAAPRAVAAQRAEAVRRGGGRDREPLAADSVSRRRPARCRTTRAARSSARPSPRRARRRRSSRPAARPCGRSAPRARGRRPSGRSAWPGRGRAGWACRRAGRGRAPSRASRSPCAARSPRPSASPTPPSTTWPNWSVSRASPATSFRSPVS